MAYNELIKNYKRVRDYMRELYVYGFKSRDEYNKKSTRSYDDERRRLESWMGDYMQFRTAADGKNVFLSIDSRCQMQNPLYKSWKTKSFTDGDITLHFILLDILNSKEIRMTLSEIMEETDQILSEFENPRYFDESTVRKKLKEYENEGIILKEKIGKKVYYKRAADVEIENTDFLDFFTEVAPCGVIGSYLSDKIKIKNTYFAFKHHYITEAMDSEIMYMLFEAMHKKLNITLERVNQRNNAINIINVVPLRIFISVQNGRQYLMAYISQYNRISSYRIDNIVSVKYEKPCENFDLYRKRLENMSQHIWGVSTQSTSGSRMEYVEFTVKYNADEQHIHNRLEREKRCGHVEKIDEFTSRFFAEVYDASELIPWIRSFICRITDISFSNKRIESQFRKDLEKMYKMYEVE